MVNCKKYFGSVIAAIAIGVFFAVPVQAQSQLAANKSAQEQVQPQTTPQEEPGEQYEWVYRIKYGYQDEWWNIFQKYQIGELDRLKELGVVKDYRVEKPNLHTSEDSRWDIRVIITYAPRSSIKGPIGNVTQELFPDKTKRIREENRRWELTLNHWDLPIHVINPHKNPWGE